MDVQSLPDAFIRDPHLEFGAECVLWEGPVAKHNPRYGWDTKARTWAHRAAYEKYCGKIPKGMEIDHLCCVQLCVNPLHMEVVTHKENMRRAKENGLCKPGRNSGKINFELAERIRILKQAGLSHKELMAITGLGWSLISGIINYRRYPSPGVLKG